ncbi:MAG: hypothetical protein U5M23_02115 [Marinagarivorans sp.]|nr:hypothetical protein [Marinagarivorans sp.]
MAALTGLKLIGAASPGERRISLRRTPRKSSGLDGGRAAVLPQRGLNTWVLRAICWCCVHRRAAGQVLLSGAPRCCSR